MKITRHGDIGTKELLKHKSLKITLIDGQPKARVSNVSPIHTMYERGNLTIAQFSAAKKLYECFIAGWGENGSYEIRERVDGSGKELELTERQLHCMKEYQKGIKAAGKEKKLIDHVIIQEIPLTSRMTPTQERVRLRYRLRWALDDIARVYGFM